ncbi:MAG TPA: YaiI/YqxD family protein [Clostridia bacterium]|nr:YaiI/YqxD family protein [Clostridia bacterium]
MRILIDADGCPVVDICIACAKKHEIECLLICDTSHVFEKEDAKTITVSKGADSVDYALVNMLEKGDVVVTQDYGLAAMVLARAGFPITQNGLVIGNANIESLLAQRHVSKKIRNSGGRLKGPSKRNTDQDVSFERNLEKLIESLKSAE